MPDDKNNDASANEPEQVISNVQPIEVVRGVPDENSEQAEVVKVFNKPNLQESGAPTATVDEESAPVNPESPKVNVDECWNCGSQLNDVGYCSNCGFDKSIIYNHNLEAEKAQGIGA